MEKAGFTPLEPYKSAKSQWKCRCLECGRVSKPTYWNTRNSKSKKKGCAICVGVRVDPKEVREKMLKAGLKPLSPYKGKDLAWKCRCLVCKAVVTPTWNNIRKGQGGCGTCRYVKSGTSNRTPEKDAIARMLKAGLQPLEPYANQFTPWKSKCLKCWNTTFPMLANISKGQGGCPNCRETGLNYLDPAYLYVMHNSSHNSLKIGVSNTDSKPNRIKQHTRHGWVLLKVFHYESGREAEAVETKILRWLRKDLKLPAHLIKSNMPQGGHSETVSAEEISHTHIIRKIQYLNKAALKA